MGNANGICPATCSTSCTVNTCDGDDEDRDNDGIPDDIDICPDEHQGENPDPERLGCPLGDDEEETGVRAVLNSGFKIPASEQDEVARYWRFTKGKLGKATASIIRAKQTDLAKAEAVRIEITRNPLTGMPALNQRDVDLDPNKTYKISFVARSSANGRAVIMFRDMGYVQETLAPSKSFDLQQGWKLYESTVTTKDFNPNKAAIVSLGIKLPNGSNIVIDNVIVASIVDEPDADTDSDGDGDGVPDTDDICPTVHKGPTPDPERLGCPLEDDDDDDEDIGGKQTKKWHPGHYIQHKSPPTPAEIAKYFNGSDPRYNAVKGVLIGFHWSVLENERDQYTLNNIQKFIDVLPENKQLIVLIFDRDVQAKSCATARLPKYLKQSGDVGQMGTVTQGVFTPGRGCIVNYWEPDVREREIKLLKKVGESFDNNPQVEAVLLAETTWGATKDIESGATLSSYQAIHTEANTAFKKTHLVKMMNHLSGGAGPCGKLRTLADTLIPLGQGMGNPDSVPWDALPWNCNPPARVGENKEDKSKPVYTIYRENGNKLTKMVGNDTSQMLDPEHPRMFNNERMNMENLVKYLYLTAVPGYTYKTGENIPGLGANYMFWNSGFWSHETANSGRIEELSNAYINTYLDFINQPGHGTIQTCPQNIKCATN